MARCPTPDGAHDPTFDPTTNRHITFVVGQVEERDLEDAGSHATIFSCLKALLTLPDPLNSSTATRRGQGSALLIANARTSS